MKGITYYWACPCGASPLRTVSRKIWFKSEAEALAAGKPVECHNVYCHSRQDSRYYDPKIAENFSVHFLDTRSRV